MKQRVLEFCERHDSERGTVLLFIAAVVLPFIFFLFSLLIDVAMYLHEEREVQTLLDKGGLYVQRFLPYVPEAQAAFDSYILENPTLTRGVTTLRYEPASQLSDVLTLRYERTFSPFFANLFNNDIGFNLQVQSQVRVSPFNVQILLDASSYLAPPLDAPQGWNSSTEQPAYLFQQGLLTYSYDFNGDQIGERVDPLVASQQCFSAPFLALKRSAVRMYQYLASFRDNAIGLGVYPSGIGGFLAPIRSLSPSLSPSAESDLSFVSWNTPFVRNEHCAAAAERETVQDQFTVPVAPDSFAGLWRAPANGGYMISQPSGWQVEQGYTDFSGESLLWAQSSRYNAQGDTAAVLQSIAFDLLALPPIESRGGLQHTVNRQAIIFAGDMPWGNGQRLLNGSGFGVNPQVESWLTTALTQIGDAVSTHDLLEFRLFYLAFFHQGLSGTLTDFQDGMAAFQTLADTVRSNYPAEVQERLTFQVLGGDDPQLLSDQVLSYLALNRRTGVIAR
ncbi:MAG: hypothetical protein KDD70_07220 [Bdellovibrionales bacterium]|nr:hypothetical protein [Bdellovibrionales bacterium]